MAIKENFKELVSGNNREKSFYSKLNHDPICKEGLDAVCSTHEVVEDILSSQAKELQEEVDSMILNPEKEKDNKQLIHTCIGYNILKSKEWIVFKNKLQLDYPDALSREFAFNSDGFLVLNNIHIVCKFYDYRYDSIKYDGSVVENLIEYTNNIHNSMQIIPIVKGTMMRIYSLKYYNLYDFYFIPYCIEEN